MKKLFVLLFLAIFGMNGAWADYDDEGEEPRIVVEAYFFALEHENFDGAYSLYSDDLKDKLGGARNFEYTIKADFPQLAMHQGREVVTANAANGGAMIVKVLIVDPDTKIYNVMFSLQIEQTLWKIKSVTLLQIGESVKSPI